MKIRYLIAALALSSLSVCLADLASSLDRTPVAVQQNGPMSVPLGHIPFEMGMGCIDCHGTGSKPK